MIKNGDIIRIDATENKLEVLISDEEMEARRKAWVQPAYKATKGILKKYINSVKSASEGCVTDE